MSAPSDISDTVLTRLRLGPPGHGGVCVARYEGRVVFVRHGLPGELVHARVIEDTGGSYCRAEAVEILEPSPDRQEPACPVSGPGGAGCCDLTHARPEAQRRWKAAVVAEQVCRIAGIDYPVTVEPIPDFPSSTGWRTRVRLPVDTAGRPGLHRFRSDDILPDLRCQQPYPDLLSDLAEGSFTPGAELVVARGSLGERHLVELGPAEISRPTRRGKPGSRRRAVSHRQAAAGPRPWRVLEGSGQVSQQIDERVWTVSATGFWQPHLGAAQCYSHLVAEWAQASPGALAWDLYCGVGIFAAQLAEQVGPGGRVCAVESSSWAVADGAESLRDLSAVEFHQGRVERWVREHSEQRPEVVVLDPPRAGAGGEVIRAITATHTHRIVHFGCDPATFARDIGSYRAADYRLSQVRVFDAYPGTHHMECVALLMP